MLTATQTTTPDIDYAQRGRDFLKYVSTHEKEIKKGVAKTTTFDPDIYDDVYGTCIMNIYTSIVRNHVEVKSFKMYIYQSLKWAFLAAQNKQKKLRDNSLRNFYDNPRNNDGCLDYDIDFSDEDDRDEIETREARQASAERILALMKTQLQEKFGEDWTSAYFHYYSNKSGHRAYSFERLAQWSQKPLTEVKRTIKQMKDYVNESFDFEF